ncbi:MAG TPA: hypothetical protein VND19_14745 [Acetobacteraceae bacterium]|nr:hypothetical protein [Acetobacteraceae bacterium]
MIKTTLAALGILGLLAGAALAAHAPNDVGVTGMGGGVYYNPSLDQHQAQPAGGSQRSEVGVTGEGGGAYHNPDYSRNG